MNPARCTIQSIFKSMIKYQSSSSNGRTMWELVFREPQSGCLSQTTSTILFNHNSSVGKQSNSNQTLPHTHTHTHTAQHFPPVSGALQSLCYPFQTSASLYK